MGYEDMGAVSRGGQIILLPSTNRLPNRTAIDRLPTNFGFGSRYKILFRKPVQ
jgi:hypothetical protein